ncbi:MAG: hypothetical protein WD511_02240 [Balneolaceae bacterium]
MKIISLLFASFILISCTDNTVTVLEESVDEFKIKAINYIPNGDEDYENNFEYDNSGKLIHSKDHHYSTRFKLYEYYGNDKLKLVSTYSTLENEEPKLIGKDSISYNEDSSISTVVTSWRNDNEEVLPDLIYTYEYKDDVLIIKQESPNRPQEYLTKYFWEAGNITKTQRFSSEDKLDIEFFYNYDEKYNFKKDSPLFVTDPFSLTQNNVTRYNAKDYTGLYDPVCNPCRTFYNYNSEGLPVEVNHEWNKIFKILYQ